MEYSVYANYSKMQYSIVLQAVADPEILKKRGGAEDNVSASSLFIANAYGKRRLNAKNSEPIDRRGAPPLPPPESATDRSQCAATERALFPDLRLIYG